MTEGVKSATEIFGGRILKDIEHGEESLESLLATLRTTHLPNPSRTGLPPLDTILSHHVPPSSKLSLSGRSLPLLSHILSTLLSSPFSQTIVLIDLSSRFSPSFLSCSKDDLQHLHVFRPNKANFKETVESVEKYMLYGEHGSKSRVWGGVVIAGVEGGEGLVGKGMERVVLETGWWGWLKVEREDLVGEVGFMGVIGKGGVSLEEAVDERERWWGVCRERGWKAEGLNGEGIFTWT